MRSLSYRTKLLFAFWGLAILISLAIGFLTIRKSRQALFQQIQSNVVTIAVGAANEVDVALHEQIREEGDQNGEGYRQIEQSLRKIRDLNRRDDVYVEFIYTMRRIAENPDRWIYVVDAEEPGEDKSEIGEVIEWEGQGEPGDEALILGEAYADNEFTIDNYGHWLTGYAPIRDSRGEIVAMLGADLRAQDVIAKRDFILYSGLIALGIAILFGAVLSYLLSNWATQPLRQITGVVRKIGTGHLDVRLPENRVDEFGEVSTAFNEMAKSLQERDALKGALSRYVSRDMGERLIEEGKLPLLRGDRQQMTVMFCDSNNVGLLAEKFPPQMTVEILNDYFEQMVDIIFRHHGTLDRLCGNGLMAVFGAPLGDESMEKNAIRAAIEMQSQQDRLNEKWGLGDGERFQMGLGIHTGEAIVGNIGVNNRVEFTAVGKTVKIAAMIEGLNSKYRTTGLVSETAAAAIRKDFNFREVGDIQLEERSALLRLYTLSQFAKAG